MHIKDWMTTIHCGLGNQPLRWIGDVAVHKYDQNYNMTAGTPCGLRFENGTECGFNSTAPDNTVADVFTDDIHVYLLFKEDGIEITDKKNAKATKKK